MVIASSSQIYSHRRRPDRYYTKMKSPMARTRHVRWCHWKRASWKISSIASASRTNTSRSDWSIKTSIARSRHWTWANGRTYCPKQRRISSTSKRRRALVLYTSQYWPIHRHTAFWTMQTIWLNWIHHLMILIVWDGQRAFRTIQRPFRPLFRHCDCGTDTIFLRLWMDFLRFNRMRALWLLFDGDHNWWIIEQRTMLKDEAD